MAHVACVARASRQLAAWFPGTFSDPVSLRQVRVLLPTNVTPSHYDVSLTPWQEYKEEVPGFTGSATVDLTVNEP